MSFLETPRFPGCPSFGFVAEPQFQTQIVQMQSGYEVRNQLWSRALLRFTATVGPREEAEIYELLEFWRALGGQFTGFRFKDWSDFRSCPLYQEPSATDQALSVDSDGIGQLYKIYQVGARTEQRIILKPVQGTILIARNGTTLIETTDYTIDYSTGEVDMVDGSGTLTWGGEFDVPVRFDSGFPVEIVSNRVQSVGFSIMELRAP